MGFVNIVVSSRPVAGGTVFNARIKEFGPSIEWFAPATQDTKTTLCQIGSKIAELPDFKSIADVKENGLFNKT